MSGSRTNGIPAALAEVIEEFGHYDRGERAEMLIHYADRFVEAPSEVATRPFPESSRVPRCESEAYVWAVDRPDGTLKFHFAVESPQGLSAKAWCVILDDTLSGAPLDQVVNVSADAIYEIFGRDLSMGKGQGLIGILDVVTHAARQRLTARRSAAT